MDPKAVRRHERTIFGCLEDPDISIRRRAIELAFTLINNERDVGLLDKLLGLLSRGKIDNEFKSALASKVSVAADRFAPNKRWHIDTILRILKLAGNYVKEQIMSSFIRLIATSPSEQDYCVRELYAALVEARDGKPQAREEGGVVTEETLLNPTFTEGLTLASAWVLGEYGHRLLGTGVSGYEIVSLLETILGNAYNSQTMKEYVINALMKLSTRLPATEGQHNNVVTIARILKAHTASLDVEIQQRSAEYANMFNQLEEVRIGVFENMPAPEIREESRVLGQSTAAAPAKPKRGAKKDQESALMELLISDTDTPASNPVSLGGSGNLDLLSEILGGAPMSSATSPPPQQKSNVANILDLFDSSSGSPSPANTATPPSAGPNNTALLDVLGGGASVPPTPQQVQHTIYSKDNLEILLQIQRQPDGSTVYIRARLVNTSFAETLEELQLQAAPPRGMRLELREISTTTIIPAGEATLQMRLSDSKGAPVRLRLKVAYKNGAAGLIRDQFDWVEKKN